MTKRIFISYRRDDSAGHAGRVFDRLRTDFGQDVLFMDVDAIPLGANFVRVLREEVAKCEVLLAIIGPGWLAAKDDAGSRRLDNANDFVRIEIAAALARDIPVIPILLEGTRMPNAALLPADLAELSQRQALGVRHESFHADMDKLVRGLRAKAQPIPAPPAAMVAAPVTASPLLEKTPKIEVAQSYPSTPVPSPEAVIAARGQWVKEFKSNESASTAPDIFGHLFMVSGYYERMPSSTAGTIVTGRKWDKSDDPFWTVQHGFCDPTGWCCNSVYWLTYLGPTWQPEYAALSDAVFKQLGGKSLERFITHP